MINLSIKQLLFFQLYCKADLFLFINSIAKRYCAKFHC